MSRDPSTTESRIARYVTLVAVVVCAYGAAVWHGRAGEPGQLLWLGFYGAGAASMLGCWAHLGGVDLHGWGRRAFASGRRGFGVAASLGHRAKPVVVAALVVTSTFGGVVLVGTQPITDAESGTVSAAEGDELWRASTGIVYNSPTIADGTAYIGSNDGSLYAINASTGEQKWTAATGNAIRYSSPTVANGTVFVGSFDNSLYAFDAETGDQKWSAATGGDISSSPTVKDGTVYVGSKDNSLYAFNASTGDQEWSAATGGTIGTSSPTVKDGTVYIGSKDDSLHAFDAETGDQEWSAATAGDIESSPTVSDGTVYVGSNDNSLYAFDANTGDQEWSTSTGGRVRSSPTVANGTVYVGSNDNSLYAFDATTGNQKWSFSTGGGVRSSPTVANGTVYVGSKDESLYAVDADTGDQKWSSPGDYTMVSSPTVANGTVYVGSDGLHAFDTSHSKDSSGSRNRLHTLGHVGGVYQSAGGSGGGADINGTVENQAGQPVSNATVVAWGVDYSNITASDTQTLEDRAEELLQQASDPKPPSWDSDLRLTGSNGVFGSAETEYVAVHSTEDWGLGPAVFDVGGVEVIDNPVGLGDPMLQAPAGEPVVVSVWDPGEGSSALIDFQDTVNSDLPGKTVDDTAVVIKQLGPGGGTTSTQTVNTSTTVRPGGAFSGAGEHQIGFVELPPGFYQIHPKGSPESSYTLVVGNPDRIAEAIESDLKSEAGQLSDRAQNIREKLDEGKFQQVKTTTNENGSFNFSTGKNVETVAIQAYKTPAGMPTDPTDATLEDIRTYYSSTDYNGSVVLPADVTRTDVPQGNVTVDVREYSAPKYPDLGVFENKSEAFEEFLKNLDYSDLPPQLQQRLEEMNREEVEELSRELTRLTNENSRLEQRVEELMGRDMEEIEINDSSDEELIEMIQAQQKAISELRATIEATESNTDVGDGVADSSATFAQELTKEQVRIVANFQNGTSREVPSEYISLDQSAATIVGEGGTTIAVEDYPIGDADGMTFDYIVVTESGLGETTTGGLSPNADSIGLDAISLSTLRPGPDEQVDVTLVGDDETQVANIIDVRAVAPDGTELATSTSGADTATFTTSGEGRHYVEVTFETASGEQGTLTHRIAAGNVDQAMPPGIRIKDTPFGTVAVVGDGYEAGSVDTANGGQQIDVTAQIGADEDAPARTHPYAHGTDRPPTSTLNVNIVRGENQRAVQRHVQVTAHLPAITTENAVLYRNGEALPREGEGQLASVSTSADETTIVTVTDARGSLELTTNSNPGIVERGEWWIDRNTPEFSLGILGQLPAPPTLPLDVSGALGWVGPVQAAAPAPTIDTAAAAPSGVPA